MAAALQSHQSEMSEALESIDTRMLGIKVEAKNHKEEYDEYAKGVTE